ncbi:MAG: LysR family transcriptional regulator [Proteobacteria bacterium]|nr:LysR family transcriptional regulator [Pseudomonadota bacterium]
MSVPNDTTPRPKVRLEIKQGTAIGPGKARLLEAMARTGSISAAARELDMSYRRAWLLASSLNQAFKSPLIEASKGGSGGGGALLTPLGYEVLRRYRRMEYRALRAIESDMRAFNALLREGDDDPSALDVAADVADELGSDGLARGMDQPLGAATVSAKRGRLRKGAALPKG